ncbi:unnamed protein product [Linum tenue]|uniref:Uncharacterized protein n=1 Tax=Linum tenue TaxID=586396 RepID=A0AAV0RY23_9ROSI|nr:unnamed protein product [Linum tenue]
MCLFVKVADQQGGSSGGGDSYFPPFTSSSSSSYPAAIRMLLKVAVIDKKMKPFCRFRTPHKISLLPISVINSNSAIPIRISSKLRGRGIRGI